MLPSMPAHIIACSEAARHANAPACMAAACLHPLCRRGNANTRQRGYGIKGDMLGPRGIARSPIVKRVPTTWTAVALRSGQGAGRG